MSDLRQKILTGVGVVILLAAIAKASSKSEPSGLAGALYEIGVRQEQTADILTDAAVTDVEGHLVGEDAVDGTNWSIPAILRNIFAGG